MPQGKSIQDFCLKNKVSYNLIHKWYKDTRHQIVLVQVEGESEPEANLRKRISSSPIPERKEIGGSCPVRMIDIRSDLEKSDRETGWTILNVTGTNRSYYLRNFHDMRCNMNGCYSSFTIS